MSTMEGPMEVCTIWGNAEQLTGKKMRCSAREYTFMAKQKGTSLQRIVEQDEHDRGADYDRQGCHQVERPIALQGTSRLKKGKWARLGRRIKLGFWWVIPKQAARVHHQRHRPLPRCRRPNPSRCSASWRLPWDRFRCPWLLRTATCGAPSFELRPVFGKKNGSPHDVMKEQWLWKQPGGEAWMAYHGRPSWTDGKGPPKSMLRKILSWTGPPMMIKSNMAGHGGFMDVFEVKHVRPWWSKVCTMKQ